VADRLDDLVLGQGGGRRDLQVLLEAELGPLLHQRRARLAALLEGRMPTRAEPLSDEPSTLVALEAGLDAPEDPTPDDAPEFPDATEPMHPGPFEE
jgi:hypothetical protein